MRGIDGRGLAALLLLADGRLPAGAYAHSGGLEPAVAAGRVADMAGLERFLIGRTETAGFVAAVFAAVACDHCHDVRIALAGTVRMILREETVLGRHGETPGDFTSRLRLIRDGTALYDQQLSFGPSADGWNGAAILGDAGAVGSVIAVNPGWASDMPAADPFHRNAALTPLPGPGVAVSAVAPDSLELRRLLTHGLNELGPPWAI